MKTTIDLVDSDEDDDERQASDERYAHFGLELDERKEPHAHPSSSSQRSSTSLQLETDAQFAQALIFQDIAGFSSSSPPSTSSSSSFPSSTPPRWVSSHPNDPSNNPALRADLIAQHHEQLNSPEPHVNVHDLFLLYSQLFFFNQLQAVNVRWSKRMTTCAGLCRFDTRSGGCDIAMSEPLLKYRQKKEVMETLLHEMVHAFLFVGDHNMKDHDDHGPHFCSQMAMINATLGLNITVYHSFIDEVRHFKVHVWQCQGKCAQWKPYMGKVSRATNRKPGPADKWVSTATPCTVSRTHLGSSVDGRLTVFAACVSPVCCAVGSACGQLRRDVPQGSRADRGGDEGGAEAQGKAAPGCQEGGEGAGRGAEGEVSKQEGKRCAADRPPRQRRHQ